MPKYVLCFSGTHIEFLEGTSIEVLTTSGWTSCAYIEDSNWIESSNQYTCTQPLVGTGLRLLRASGTQNPTVLAVCEIMSDGYLYEGEYSDTG